jgi:ribosomal silencing factor RsfS
MEAAVAAHMPAEALAARILDQIKEGREPEERYRFGHWRLVELRKAILPLTAYEERLFAALDAAMPDYDFPD